MTSSINIGDIHDNPHFSSQEMGIFCIPPTPTSKTTEPSLVATALLRPHAHAAQKTPNFSRILPRFLVKSPEFPNKATNNWKRRPIFFSTHERESLAMCLKTTIFARLIMRLQAQNHIDLIDYEQKAPPTLCTLAHRSRRLQE